MLDVLNEYIFRRFTRNQGVATLDEAGILITHVKTAPWRKPKDLRGGEIWFKDLLLGDEGEIDNLHLSLVKTGADYFTPRHRHNFDQFRVVLDGALHYGKDLTLPTGSVAYFGEGSYYGPTEGREPALWLLLQFGSASRSGYLSQPQLFRAMDDLVAQGGSFSQGVFTRRAADGRKFNQDAYEAIWEHCNGTTLVYPAARYPQTLVCSPDAFAWSATSVAGVSQKPLMRVTERAVDVVQYQVMSGARMMLAVDEQQAVGYVLSGAGVVDGEAFDGPCAWQIPRGGTSTLVASTTVTALVFRLTRFSDEEIAAASRRLTMAS